jgi:uncharacterized protein
VERLRCAGFVALAALALAGAASAFEVPPSRAYVTDSAGVIPDDTERRLESELMRVANDHGVQLAVLTVASLDGETVESAAQKVFDAWKMGKKGDDRGALLLVAPKDRKIRLQVGYGLEGDLPDGKVGALLDQHVLPLFKGGDFSGGIVNGVHAVLRELKIQPGLGLDPPRPVRRRGRRQASAFEQMLTMGFIILVFVLCVASPAFRRIVIDLLWYSAIFGGHGHGGHRNDHFGSYSGGSGFGGFGGGSSGGGGASRGW